MKSKVGIVELSRPHGRRGTSQVHGIDIIRFLCAVSVAFYHLAFLSWVDPRIDAASRARASVLHGFGTYASTGWVGVEIFFVISGYVIAYTANGRSPIAFINSRILRLVPGVVACALIAIPALVYSGDGPRLIASKLVRTLLFSPARPWTSGAFWTLGVEITFYAGILLLLLAKQYRRIEVAAYLLGLYSALPWIFAALVKNPGARIGHLVHWFETARAAELMVVHHGVFFAIGIITWLCHHDRVTGRRLVFLAIFTVAALIEVACQADTIAAFMLAPIPGTVACAAWAVGMAGIVLSLVFNQKIAHGVANAQGVVRAIGLSTFPFYLLHQPVGGAILDMGLLHGIDPFVALFAAIAANIILSFAVALVIEPYLRGLLHRVLIKVESWTPPRLESLRESTQPI